MINFCSITPLKNAELMYEQHYVMLLAHLAEKSKKYVDLAKSHKLNYKIMDNSIIELGESFSMERLVKQAERCGADEIILPDVFQNGNKTVKSVKESIKWLKDNGYLGKFKLMAVCHGRDTEEFKKCFEKLNEIKEIDTIGIPKVLCRWCGNRDELCYIYCHSCKQIHLLGVASTMTELKLLAKTNFVRSVDSCMPSLLTIQNKKWNECRDGTIDLMKEKVDVVKYHNMMNEIKEHLTGIE